MVYIVLASPLWTNVKFKTIRLLVRYNKFFLLTSIWSSLLLPKLELVCSFVMHFTQALSELQVSCALPYVVFCAHRLNNSCFLHHRKITNLLLRNERITILIFYTYKVLFWLVSNYQNQQRYNFLTHISAFVDFIHY